MLTAASRSFRRSFSSRLAEFVRQNDRGFLALCTAYCAFGIISIYVFRFNINPDGVSYLGVAETYLRGELWNAINGYWAPLLPWLLVPLLAVGVPGLIATKIIGFISGGVALLLCQHFVRLLTLREPSRCAVRVCLVPVILSMWTTVITPDLLLAVSLLAYLWHVLSEDFGRSAKRALFCGLCGAISYYAKQVGMLLFVIHFSLIHLLLVVSSNRATRSRVAESFSVGLSTFLACTLPWIAMLSIKYNMLNAGTSFIYAYRMVGPGSHGHPMLLGGLFDPPYAGAYSIAEDISYLLPKLPPHWSPFQSKAAFIHQLVLIRENLRETGIIMHSFSFLAFPIILFLLAVSIQTQSSSARSRRSLHLDLRLVNPISAVLILSAVYLPVMTEARYLWIANFVLLIFGAYCLQLTFDQPLFRDQRRRTLLTFVFVASFTLPPLSNMASVLHYGESFRELAAELGKHCLPGTNVASNALWDTSLFVSYHLGGRYVGQINGTETPDRIAEDLRSHEVGCYLVWGRAGATRVPGMRQAADLKVRGLARLRAYVFPTPGNARRG